MGSRNVVLGITGYEGGGKTHFWISAPKPIVAISTDTNTEATVKAILGVEDDDEFDADILTLIQVNMPTLAFDEKDDVKDESEAKWDVIRDALRPMVKNKADRPRTLVFDTASDVFDLRVLAMFGKKDQIAPDLRRNMMGQANTSYKGIIQAFKDVGVNVILVHRAKDKWVDKETLTNRGMVETREKLNGPFDMEREGFKGTGFITSVEIHVAFDPLREAKLRGKYGMQVVRCNQRPGIIGKTYWGTEKVGDERIHRVSFPFLMTQLYTRTSLEDWR